ncbi:arylesterase [Alteromonas ponticola]|nr:arylesterase [Alteromonas sp. ASW11-130]MCW8091387.1 arylesterase [Alteromonas sp. ASW11-130]
MVFSDHLHATTENENPQKPKLLILGDSLSAAYGLKQHEGWVSLLQNIWKDESVQIEVVNAAISGETTDGGLARLPRLLEQHRPSHLLIELGGNDGLQGHPVTKMRRNLHKMVSLAKQAEIAVLLQDMEIPTNYGRKYQSLFSDSFETVAEEQQITLIPFFLQDVATKDSLMQRDGIHPNKAAQPMIAEYMNKQLTPHILNTN